VNLSFQATSVLQITGQEILSDWSFSLAKPLCICILYSEELLVFCFHRSLACSTHKIGDHHLATLRYKAQIFNAKIILKKYFLTWTTLALVKSYNWLAYRFLWISRISIDFWKNLVLLYYAWASLICFDKMCATISFSPILDLSLSLIDDIVLTIFSEMQAFSTMQSRRVLICTNWVVDAKIFSTGKLILIICSLSWESETPRQRLLLGYFSWQRFTD
jgi:hypothetical protein